MNLRKLTALILVCCSLMLTNPVSAQTDCVKVKFKVDGKEVKQKFRVVLYFNNEVVEPVVTENGFIVPPEIRSIEKVNVRFLSGEYDLFFESVYLPKFKTDWIVGVDKKPFDKENLPQSQTDEELLGVYYITFIPKGDGLETRMVVEVYK